jgi:hypothetical protein
MIKEASSHGSIVGTLEEGVESVMETKKLV